MRYNVGDKVVIRKDLVVGKYYDGCYFADEMKKIEGAITTILGVRSSHYKLETCRAYNFVDEMIDHEATAKLNSPKSLLKSGDKVTYRDGTVRWVLVETNSAHDENGRKGIDLNSYNDEQMQENRAFSHCDIMKIERGTELIWEREEKSAKQIEIEAIENEMKKLAERLEQVRKEM